MTIIKRIFNIDGGGRKGPEYYRGLIVEHLGFIESRCYKACGLAASRYGEDLPGANRADALVVEVMEHLSADDYRVLREYKGNSSLKRYLEVIISNKVVDLYRGKEGRSRALEEARKMGETGVRLYDMVFVKGMQLEQAHEVLKSGHGYADGIDRLEEMAERIGSRRKTAHREVPMGSAAEGRAGAGAAFGVLKVLKDDSGQLTVPDDSENPESALVQKENEAGVFAAMREIASALTPEERLMIKLRFTDGRKVRDIARALGEDEKAMYRRFSNMLARCRALLEEKGIGPDGLW